MIPKIIHQTWKNHELPDNLQHWHNIVKELHPGWEIKLWSDEENLALVREHFPHMLGIYNALQYPIMRVDIARYMYMAVHGGYYLDLDYELFVSFDTDPFDTELLLPVSREKNGKPVLGNCIFGSAPHHSFWKDTLDDFHTNPPTKKIYNKHDILKLTGPEFISEIYLRNPDKYQALLTPKDIFHPSSQLVSDKNYRVQLQKNGSRGIHHCEGSWLATKNPFVYVLSKISSKIRAKK